jgi:hypothetical protein
MALTRFLGSAILAVGLFAVEVAAEEVSPGGGLFASPTEVRPLLVGSTIPEGTLRDERGKETTVAALMGDGPAVFIFYRGHW